MRVLDLLENPPSPTNRLIRASKPSKRWRAAVPSPAFRRDR
ncbi:hypothetical protein [Mesorhizobium sp. M7A.F.Ca.US.008.03.1.1]